MTSWLRFVITLLRSQFTKPFGIGERGEITFRVWPQECDLRFINNAKVLTLLEMGRLHFMVGTGFFGWALKRRWRIPIGAIQVTYHRPMRRLQKVRIATEVSGWDEKWFSISQRITDERGKLLVTARVQAIVKNGKETVSPASIIGEMGNPEFKYLSGG